MTKSEFKIPDIDFENNIKEFLQGRDYKLVEASYDYCFNHFHKYKTGKIKDDESTLNSSCRYLYCYLGNYGMLRKGFLREKNFLILKPIIKKISKTKEYWDIDVDNYLVGDNINKLMELSDELKKIFRFEKGDDENSEISDILITKIILGITGSIPAYDRYFSIGLFSKTSKSLTRSSLEDISHFYSVYKNEIDIKKNTLDETKEGKETNILYTKAKILDMGCYIQGKIDEEKAVKLTKKKAEKLTVEDISKVKKYRK